MKRMYTVVLEGTKTLEVSQALSVIATNPKQAERRAKELYRNLPIEKLEFDADEDAIDVADITCEGQVDRRGHLIEHHRNWRKRKEQEGRHRRAA